MRIFLDTHTFLWFISNDAELSAQALDLITDPEIRILLSVASLWEIAIKFSNGRLQLKQPFAELISSQLEMNRFELWPINPDALILVSTLPFHHRDPFDRLLIAQAIVENTPIVTRDSAFSDYPVQIIW